MTGLTPYERETVVRTSDGDDLAYVWTAQRKAITRLRKSPAFTEVRSGHDGSTAWAEFTVPADQWSPVGVIRKRKMTEAQRLAQSERAKTSLLGRSPGNTVKQAALSPEVAV